MSICESCGVEVEQGLASCPLCRAPMGHARTEERQPPRQAAADTASAEQKRRALRRWLLEAVTLLAGAGAIVVVAADFAYDMVLTWSLYPLAAIGFLWVSALAGILLHHRPAAWLACQTAALLAFLYALDAITGDPRWFVSLALPCAVLAVVLAAAAAAATRGRLRAPLPATALALLAAGLYLVGLEQILNRHASRALWPGWSLVALGCILPVALVLLFLHRWLRQHPEVLRLFHL